MTTTDTVTVHQGDGRFVVQLPVSIDLLVVLLAGLEARHPGCRCVDTGRDDVLVVEL